MNSATNLNELSESLYGPIDPRSIGHSSYQIKGFRSLLDFNVCLTPGLNVLLGTNGSGKTNFIDFLDFITILVNQDVAAAVSAAGGVARVFSQEVLKRKVPRVTAKICGVADLTPFSIPSSKKNHFKFEYEVDIKYSKYHSAVFISNEKVKFKNLFDKDNPFDTESTVGSLELHRFSPLNDEEVRWTVGNYLVANSGRNPLKHIHNHRLPPNRSKVSRGEMRAELLSQPPGVASDESILSSRSAFQALDAVRFAIARGRTFNLNPQKARSPDDISTPPTIGPDGSGLSAMLYQMHQLRKSEARSSIIRRRVPKDALDTIIAWTQLVIPDLIEISATADPHSGKYLAYLHVGNPENPLKIPLQSTSDGTLKWLSFVCLIVSKGTEYTFEEPENFLHPRMQQHLISLIRESMDSGEDFDRCIISTHSETVINQCTPDEIVLFLFVDGQTHCKRLSNSESLIKQVNNTGFGLGHYYAMNVMR